MAQHRPMLALLVALALVRGLVYAAATPPWQAPDEPAQFERAKAALSTADWRSTLANSPAWYPELANLLFEFDFWDYVARPRPTATNLYLGQYIELYHQVYGGLYGSQAAYALVGWPALLAANNSLLAQLYWVRVWMVLLNAGIVLLAIELVRAIFPTDRFLLVGVPLLIIFNPQHTYLLAAVNNGNLAEILSLLALLAMTNSLTRRPTWLTVGLALSAALLAMWAKATAYFLLPVLMLWAGLLLWPYRRFWRWLALAILVPAAMTGLFLPDRFIGLLGDAWGKIISGQFSLNPLVPQVMFASFWAMPGWLTLQLDRVWYQMLLLFVALAGAGLLAGVWRQRAKLSDPARRPQLKALLLLAVAVAVAVTIPLVWSAIAGTIAYRQGRSIYPVIAPLCLFLLLGWRQLLPAGWRNFGLLAITALLVLFDSVVLIYYVLPFFYSRF